MFFFCCLGGGPGPAQTAKNKKHAPPLPSVFFFVAVWAGGCVHFFCCLGGGRVFCFAVWAGFFFLLFGRGRVLFLLFERGRVFFCCLGRGRVFLLFGRGTGVHSLTRLPGSSLSDPTTKETEQQKKNTGSPPTHYSKPHSIIKNLGRGDQFRELPTGPDSADCIIQRSSLRIWL